MSDNWIAEKRIKAKVAHKCDGCHGVIKSGTTYRKDVGCHDGDFFAVTMHRECRLLWHDIWYATKEPGDTMSPFIPDELSEMDDGDPFIEQYNTIAAQYGGHVYEITPPPDPTPAPDDTDDK